MPPGSGNEQGRFTFSIPHGMISGMAFDIDIIGYDCGWGCRDRGCENGPEGADITAILDVLRQSGHRPVWTGVIGAKNLHHGTDITTKQQSLPLVLQSLQLLYQRVHASASQGRLPLVIGGDHSSGIATWSAIAAARKIHGDMGLIWIDAHLDSHTLETSFQGKYGGWWHGQPVAALLGHGLDDFVHMGGKPAKIRPEHLFFVGPHSFETLEKEFLDRNKVRIFQRDEVAKQGFATLYGTAQKEAAAAGGGFGVSLDLDVFCPQDAPGVGAPEETGLQKAEVLPGLRGTAYKRGFLGIEIAEYNPSHDIDRKTSRLITEIIAEVFQPHG
jgi:arginase